MNQKEFRQWVDDYERRCWSRVKEFLVEHECGDVWLEDLEGYSLQECLEANRRLRGEDAPRYEQVPLAVAQEAFRVRRKFVVESATEGAAEDSEDQPEMDRSPRFVDGRRTFSCRNCLDSGTVSVASPTTIKAAKDLVDRGSDVTRFPVTYCHVFCSCQVGRQACEDFARTKWGKDGKDGGRVEDYLSRYGFFGSSDWHIPAKEIQDDMPCLECRKSKTLADWDAVGMDTLKCRNCGHLFVSGDSVRPDYEVVLVRVHAIVSQRNRGNDVLASYTEAIG